MDPKAAAQLDPKLQEAYDRVMGIHIDPIAPATNASTLPPVPPTGMPSAPTMSPDSVTPPAMPSLPQSPANPTNTAASATVPSTPDMSGPAIIEEQEETEKTPSPVMNTMENTTNVKPHGFVAKGGMGISPVIVVLGAIVFLIIYTIVWIKVFNLPVPYIN